MKESAIKVASMLLGVLIAVTLTAGAFGVLVGTLRLFPGLDHRGVSWPALILAFLLEVLLAAVTVKFWQKKRPMAVGILLAAVILGTHFVMHIASHWNG